MGRKALPANVHLLRGNPSKLPVSQLLGDDVIRPEVAIPPCPKYLGAEGQKEWRRITKYLFGLGLISHIDRAALTGYCDAWDDYVWARKTIEAAAQPGDGRVTDLPSGYKQVSVAVQIKSRSWALMKQFLAEFGMSPAARSRVVAGDTQRALPGLERPGSGGWADFE